MCGQHDVHSAGTQSAGTHRSAGAFTLIELLVVIAIIALLVSILVPSLKRAREIAHEVVCTSQLKAIGTGSTLYEEENNREFALIWDDLRIGGRFTWNEGDVHTWPDLLIDGDYVPTETGYLCPAVRRRDRKISYGMNWWAFLHVEPDGTVRNGTSSSFAPPRNRVESVRDPDGKIQIVASGIWYQNPRDYWYGSEAFIGEKMAIAPYQNLVRFGHRDDQACPVLFVDKHVNLIPAGVEFFHHGPASPGIYTGWNLGPTGVAITGY